MKRKIHFTRCIALCIVIFTNLALEAQISHGGIPLALTQVPTITTPVYSAPSIDLDALRKEDAVTDAHKDIAWRFGDLIPVKLNLNNAGVWENLPNGRAWRLTIECSGAQSINLNYNSFYMPPGAQFFLFNKNIILGAFNQENNKTNGQFATSIMAGDRVTLEYFEPLSQLGKGELEISSIVHGYRSINDKTKGFGNSGPCHINSVCDSATWGNELRSGVMLLTSSNTRFCSGSLLNNTAGDGTPYVLTADHCNPVSSNIIMFNYRSPSCLSNIDAPTTQSISGCTVVARNATAADFALLRLSSSPPASYNAYYAGWSRVNTPALEGTAIHHPARDVQKISHDFHPVKESGYYKPGNDHWIVIDWNSGSTQAGSSGSPLYDQNHRIVGQLHGGDALCGNDDFDGYGKFSVSWAPDPDSAKQLKHWLDPNNTGLTMVNGWDPTGSFYATDAAALNILGLDNLVCADSAMPQVTIFNNGNNALTSLKIYYALDGAAPTLVNWTGNLASQAMEIVNLPQLNGLSNATHTYQVYASDPNNGTDQFNLNDTITKSFIANPNPYFANLALKTDDFGGELRWVIRNNSGKTYIEGGGYPNIAGGLSYLEPLCLYLGCFSLTLYDNGSDGYCCAWGNGSMLLTNAVTGDTLGKDTAFSSDSLVVNFCLPGNDITEYNQGNFKLFPNPNSGNFKLAFKEPLNGSFEYLILDVLGNVIMRSQESDKSILDINLHKVKSGLYFVQLRSETVNETQRFIIH